MWRWKELALTALLFSLQVCACSAQGPGEGRPGRGGGLCEDHLGTGYSEGAPYYTVSYNTSGAASEAAADVVFVVDESGSVDMRRKWLRDVVPELDLRLRNRGVGAGGRENHFSLVGFGRDDRQQITGVILSDLASPEDFLPALDLLQSSGVAEDGYAALEFAIDNVVTRPDTVKQLVLVTDEDRRVIRRDLDRSSMERILAESGYILNVVVNQGFLADPADNDSHAMGLDTNRTAYVFDPSSSSLYSTAPDGVPNFNPFSFFPDTYMDYVDLALSVGGAAWDINTLVIGEPFSLALARAFAEVKVEEVMTVLRMCLSCVCGSPEPVCVETTGVELEECFGPAPDTRCFLSDGTVLNVGESAVVLSVPPSNQTRAADIILIVDESSSMMTEHAWIPEMTRQLDLALQEASVGVQLPNRFGLVGFGGDCSDGFGLGRVVGGVGGETFTFSTNFTEFSEGLTTSGRREDGYSGIQTALLSYAFREGVAKQFILITDEDRDVVDTSITRAEIKTSLLQEKVLLNVAVSQEFSGGMFRALGIDSRGGAYLFDPSASSLYSLLEGEGSTMVGSGHGSTDADYTQLALEIGGGAWDLSHLRTGGSVAASFTNAFVRAKVEEIISQLERCLNCTCTPSGPLCVPLPPEQYRECANDTITPPPDESAISLTLEPASDQLLVVTAGTDLTITCHTDNAATLVWTFNGGILPRYSAVQTPNERVSILTLPTVEEKSAGIYACLGHSPSGFYSDAVAIEVEVYDPAEDLHLSLSPLEPSVLLGQSVSLSCAVEEAGEFSWRFDDGPLPANADFVQASPLMSLLTISTAVMENTGSYTCKVNNTKRGVINEDTSYVTINAP